MNELKEYVETWAEYDSHYNHSPLKGMIVREMTAKDFAQAHALNGMRNGGEYRQIFPEHFRVLDENEVNHSNQIGAHAKHSQSIYFFVCGGNVWGLSTDYWEDKVRFWKAGCDHEFTRKTIGQFLHRASCTKCNYSVGYDSSD